MLRSLPAGLLLGLLLTTAAPGADDIVFTLDETGWKETPGWTGPSRAETYDHSYGNGVATFRAAGGGRTMIWSRHFDPPLDLTGLRYVTIRYRAVDINPELSSYFLFMTDASDGRMTSERLALGAGSLTIDGEWHTLTTQLKIRDRLYTVALRFEALPGRQGIVELGHLGITAEWPRWPIADSLTWQPGTVGQGRPLPLVLPRNTSREEIQKALLLSDWFTSEEVTVAGVPFELPADGPVAVGTPVKEKETLTVPLDGATGPLHLLLGARLSPRILTYNAWQPGDSVAQLERFAVRIDYLDGTSERQLPYCVDQGDHAVWRGLHVYEVATQPKPIERLAVRDGMVTSAFYLLAVTAGSPEQTPLARPSPVVVAGTVRAGVSPAARIDGQRVTLSNGAGSLAIDFASGPRIVGVSGDLGIDWRIGAVPDPIFQVSWQGQTWDAAAFAWERTTTTASSVTYQGTAKDAAMAARLTLTALESQEFGLELAVRNLAAEVRYPAIVFPRLGLAIEEAPEDLCYALPRQVLVLGNADRRFRTAYGALYPLQWLDYYDRARGGGVYVSTRTTDPRHRWYVGGKVAGAALARVEYLDNVPAPPDEWITLPPAVVGIHPGDWHAAFDADAAWRATWMKPLKPRLDWYRRVWHLRTHWFKGLGRTQDPEYNWYYPPTRRLRAAKFVGKDRELFGPVDYFHIFDWRISQQYGRWGDYRHYDEYGGLDEFRRAVKVVQDEGIRVGLYFDCYLASRKSKVGREHGEEWGARGHDGRLRTGYSTPDDPIVNMNVSNPGWQDYLAGLCAQVAQETGVDGIYLDEGGVDLPQYWNWRDEHGHAVAETVIAGQRVLFEKVKRALPDQVALYTEQAPCDALIPYLDGAYMHAYKYADLAFSPGYLNTVRFAFPDFKGFVIPNGGSMMDGIYDGLKYSLFNGLGLYSLAYGHDDEAFDLCRRLTELLQAHEGAFNTLRPRPLVPTLASEIYANQFPGQRETVWTLWNGRYRTYEGPVLRIPHVAGARYRDVWNYRELRPRIDDGTAIIEVRIDPRDIGMVIQEKP